MILVNYLLCNVSKATSTAGNVRIILIFQVWVVVGVCSSDVFIPNCRTNRFKPRPIEHLVFKKQRGLWFVLAKGVHWQSSRDIGLSFRSSFLNSTVEHGRDIKNGKRPTHLFWYWSQKTMKGLVHLRPFNTSRATMVRWVRRSIYPITIISTNLILSLLQNAKMYSHSQWLFYKFVSKITNKLVKQSLRVTVHIIRYLKKVLGLTSIGNYPG